MLAVIGQPGLGWVSQRDCPLLVLLYNTGARVSEVIDLTVGDVVQVNAAACVHLHGKGRKERSVPLWRSTVKARCGRGCGSTPISGRRQPCCPTGAGRQ